MGSSYELLKSYKKGDFKRVELYDQINLHNEDYEEYKELKNFNAHQCLRSFTMINKGKGSWEKSPSGEGIKTYKKLYNENKNLQCTCNEVIGIDSFYRKQ